MSVTKEYFDRLRSRSVAVIGMGVSNMPLIRMLLREGIALTVCDRSPREKLAEQAAELESLGAKLCLGDGYLDTIHKYDVIFRTPGLSPNTPQLQKALEKGREVTSEMEVFFSLCPCPIVAVTGSDGKTTTTTLISEFLKEAGYTVFVGGNIGRPLLPDVDNMTAEDIVVLELSSFQLMTMKASPHVAVFTNLSPNHLDYHHTMEEYTRAKMNIFLHQSEGDRTIFNADNEITCELAGKAPARAVLFSRLQPLEEGVYLRDDTIWLNNEMGNREVLPLSMIRLPGVHNVENYMAAIAAVDGLVPDKCVRAVAQRFTGVEHRMEPVRERNGVRWFNDSIGTSPTRTIAGLRSFPEKVILIAGGYDKQIPFESLGEEVVKRVKHLILTGATAQKIQAAVEQAPGFDPQQLPVVQVEDLAAAVALADQVAAEGDAVILSPACAAFDQFKNFMERGETFKRLVNEL